MKEARELSLIPRPSGGLAKSERAPKRLLSGMVVDALALAKANSSRARRIVILDDEYCAREIYRLMLGDFTGLEILDFGDAAAAWTELSRADPDLFITDINHPGMRCADMLAKLAARAASFHILVLSGHSPGLERVRHDCSSGLNISFILKPPSRAEFVETVGKALQIRPLLSP